MIFREACTLSPLFYAIQLQGGKVSLLLLRTSKRCLPTICLSIQITYHITINQSCSQDPIRNQFSGHEGAPCDSDQLQSDSSCLLPQGFPEYKVECRNRGEYSPESYHLILLRSKCLASIALTDYLYKYRDSKNNVQMFENNKC